jgi:hypothetical protein
MENAIVNLKKGLRAGDNIWIAEQLEGSKKSNKALVSQVLNSEKIPVRGKRLQIYMLAQRRVDFNKQVQKNNQ